MNKNARRALIGLGLTLGLGLLTVTGGVVMQAVNPGWNHGGNAENPFPNKKINKEFNPKFVTLIYIDFKGTTNSVPDITNIRATRIQFLSAGWPNGKNDWDSNQAQIAYWINYLNDETSDPLKTEKPNFWVYDNPFGLAFNQPNHVVFYIRDKNIEYDTHPVWFSDVLIRKGQNGKLESAQPNWSFFGASVETPHDAQNKPLILPGYSQNVLYIKNFFRKRGGIWPLFYYSKIGEKDPHDYSLNINTVMEVSGLGKGKLTLPIIFDPDTGNNGGGEPTAP